MWVRRDSMQRCHSHREFCPSLGYLSSSAVPRIPPGQTLLLWWLESYLLQEAFSDISRGFCLSVSGTSFHCLCFVWRMCKGCVRCSGLNNSEAGSPPQQWFLGRDPPRFWDRVPDFSFRETIPESMRSLETAACWKWRLEADHWLQNESHQPFWCRRGCLWIVSLFPQGLGPWGWGDGICKLRSRWKPLAAKKNKTRAQVTCSSPRP